MLRNLLLLCSVLLLTGSLFAQRNCGSMEYLDNMIQQNPAIQLEMDRIEQFTKSYIQNNEEKALNGNILTIPVVVHVVYSSSAQNISDAQINSQIAVLNDDFRRMNADAGNTPPDLVGRAADSEIEFCVVQTIRKSTTVSSFGTNNSVKSSSSGGSDAVNPTSSLNVWVCAIGGGILGYAQFPGGPAATDGVVCDYRYFGTTGTATAPFDLGRTMTHEVGHWLNLRHIWGDGGCSVDDFVADTPAAGGPNYTGSPCTYPGPNSCTPRGPNRNDPDDPDMFQNYMDYSDDGCMNLFTEGQKSRMWAAINASRPQLLTSACDGTPPPPTEICDNGIDDDGDGQVDCADGDCATDPACFVAGSCDTPTGLSHTRTKGGREGVLSWSAVSGANSYDVELLNGSGTVIGTASGITGTTITATGLTKNASYSFRVRANCSGGSSDFAELAFTARLAQIGNASEVSVFPNPSNLDRVQLNWDLNTTTSTSIGFTELATTSETTVRLRDLNGRVISTQLFEAGVNQSTLDIGGLSPGVYLIQLNDESGYSVTTKLVKL